ncbi:hypothetical protein INS49_014336 [Diaporthe citri]|uniref:uncharacterized protein n=1 Tax=Diaporthe citri TaxID=83186 RepID=UPI001C803F20|nr:uncharacterized protein INS49_014336 [Diaporthe citri]KAG6358452.1 hypothetical protein INS49_014336 [Diaporthe citri]
MSSGGSDPDQAEDTTVQEAGPDTSKHLLPISATDITPESRHETPDVFEPKVQDTTSGDVGIGLDLNEGPILSEVQSSLHKISNGVEELATTVHDLLGLSDSDDCDYYGHDTDGRGAFSWRNFKMNAKWRRRRRRGSSSVQGDAQSANTNDEAENSKEGSKPTKEIIPEIRECNLEQFQSREAADGHKLYCVDILVAGDSLDEDILRFRETIAKIESGSIQSWKPDHIPDRTEAPIFENTGKKWIRRIRINSRVVLQMLRHICPQLKGHRGRPAIFHRPFQLLVTLHEDLREQLANMKRPASGGRNDGTDTADSKACVGLSTSRSPNWDDRIQKLCENKDALDELACFVDFMETQIMPDSRRYRDPSDLPETVRWEDLWYLFKPGDLIYVNRDILGHDSFTTSVHAQQILRVTHSSLTNTSSDRGPIGFGGMQHFSFLGHFIEFNGVSYVPMFYIFRSIARFRGQIKVTDLPTFPVSYLKNDQILAQAVSDGETYISLIEGRSGFYSGWTQTISPFGERLTEQSSGTRHASPEHIESDILIDFQETFNAFPDWRPRSYQIMADEVEKLGTEVFRLERSDLPVLEWDRLGKTIHDDSDQELRIDYTELVEAKRFISEDVLRQFKTERPTPTGQYLALLPRRFFAYAVLERKFVQLNTRFVRNADVEANDKAFEKLEIDRNYKRLILSLVKSHFDKIETEKTTNVEIETQDLIRGKGKGVVILLHGVPGVGKTATAEAVALKWKKPLFPITCGDLGYTAETLEKSLHEIFRLAHHWGCILLLDEADVFITQRERHDLKRNALVSAFLRVLEYYNGIMFLTTNRAGVLDEAIKSRVHLNLYYDHLTEEQTVAIFRQHIQRLRDIEKQRNPDANDQIMVLHKEIIQFAKDHFNHRDNHGSGSNFGRWNGRQIRNAFLIASSLAHYDSEDEGEDEDNDELAEPGRKKQKQLGRSQFEVVAQTTLMYDQYREAVHGKSDEHVAFEREERAILSQTRPPTPVRMKNIGKGFG